MKHRAAWLMLILCAACGEGQSAAQTGDRAGSATIADTTFAGLIAALSEPGGYFDTDNLISNESSYLHALDALEDLGVSGGAYLGVGPGQNFAYIAQIRPEIAFIVDIRRDNLLEHLLFKALFARSTNRVTYLAGLFGVRAPETPLEWNDRSVVTVVDFVDRAPRDPDHASAVIADVRRRVLDYGLELSDADLQTIERFHREFISAGSELRFRSHGRAPQWYYPTYRDLVLETDRTGRQRSVFATEASFQVVRTLSNSDRIIPVVGNLAGGHAVRAIGAYLRERNLDVSAFYTSNVEFYLYGDGTFGRFAANVASLPARSPSVIIRSVFRGSHPLSLPGYASTQVVQPLDAFQRIVDDDGFRGYWDLVTREVVGPGNRPPQGAAILPGGRDDGDQKDDHRDGEDDLYQDPLDGAHGGVSASRGARVVLVSSIGGMAPPVDWR